MGFSKINANSRLRFPRVIMKKARSEEKKHRKKQREGSGVLDCVKFHSNRSRIRDFGVHACTKRAAAGRRCASPARAGGCNFVTDRKNSAHFTFMPRPAVLIPLVHALSFVILYFFFVDSTRRLTRSPTWQLRVYRRRWMHHALYIRTHTCACRYALTRVWPCLDNAITSLNFLSLCLTSVTGGPPR